VTEIKEKNTVLPETLAGDSGADLLNFMVLSSRESQNEAETTQSLLVSLSLKNIDSERRAN